MAVFRLLSKGTVEEMCYMRQIYKLQITSAAMGDQARGGRRQFNAVQVRLRGNDRLRHLHLWSVFLCPARAAAGLTDASNVLVQQPSAVAQFVEMCEVLKNISEAVLAPSFSRTQMRPALFSL